MSALRHFQEGGRCCLLALPAMPGEDLLTGWRGKATAFPQRESDRAVGIEVFERAAEARGRILRVEQLVSEGGGSNPAGGAGYLLTFDVGRILVAPDAATGGLRLARIEERGDLPGALLSLEEEEPWWRVVGNPITRVWPATTGAGAAASGGEVSAVRIQFREDEEDPRVISLRFEEGAVHVTMECRDE